MQEWRDRSAPKARYEAIAWFTGVLGFTLVSDEHQAEQDKRWVLVAPPGAGEDDATLLLPSAAFPTPLRIAETLRGLAGAPARR